MLYSRRQVVFTICRLHQSPRFIGQNLSIPVKCETKKFVIKTSNPLEINVDNLKKFVMPSKSLVSFVFLATFAATNIKIERYENVQMV